MPHEVTTDPLVETGLEHAIFERVAQPVHRVTVSFLEAVFFQELVDGRTQRCGIRTIPIEAIRESSKRIEGHAQNRNLTLCIHALELSVFADDLDVRCICLKMDRTGTQRGQLARACAGIDHEQKNRPGLLVEPIQRSWSKKVFSYPGR
ncbi:MAG: hypothetical protein BM562_18500 [Alphaproteobacteria bacterium MedPE-SWcel]|nr:MAG: hypothetical protein BM562_18500 [Alphaproteobacteria bacterium MedPE-SWcel]